MQTPCFSLWEACGQHSPPTPMLSQACGRLWNSHSFQVPQKILVGNQVMGVPWEGFC